MTESNKKDFSITTYVEIKTATGQIVDIQCRREDIDEIKKLSELIYRADLPVTKEIKNISHGCFGRYTRFDIKQKKYAGGGCGYIECIEIKNPPENRNGNIIHQCESSNSIFYEFDTIESAKKAWEKVWSRYADKLLVEFPGFIRRVNCGRFSPWFYAVANQAILGDFAFPNSVGVDHPTYRPFNKFIVMKEVYDNEKEEYIKVPEIKTCMGYNEVDCKSEYDHRKYKEYTIFWDDGTCWTSGTLKDAPELVEKDRYKIIRKTKICDYVEKKRYDT